MRLTSIRFAAKQPEPKPQPKQEANKEPEKIPPPKEEKSVGSIAYTEGPFTSRKGSILS